MCISQSVGAKGVNDERDVKAVQLLLNMNLGRLIPLGPLSVDGAMGPGTRGAIEEFQRRVLKMPKPDGRVDPNGQTLKELKKGIPSDLTEEKLRAVLIGATRTEIQKYSAALKSQMITNRINTQLRQAHFLAQIGHESGDLRYSEEIASGAAYEGRADLGNTQPGDGIRFKGRGLIQLTGRDNYKAYGAARSKDFTTGENPKQIATNPVLAVDVACWFWTDNGLNELADNDNIMQITKVVNGGYNGLPERKARLARAKCFLGLA